MKQGTTGTFGRRSGDGTDEGGGESGGAIWRFLGVAMMMVIVLVAGGGLTASSADEGTGHGKVQEEHDREKRLASDTGWNGCR